MTSEDFEREANDLIERYEAAIGSYLSFANLKTHVIHSKEHGPTSIHVDDWGASWREPPTPASGAEARVA